MRILQLLPECLFRNGFLPTSGVNKIDGSLDGPEVLFSLDLPPADGDRGLGGHGQLAEHHVHPEVLQEGVEVVAGLKLPRVTEIGHGCLKFLRMPRPHEDSPNLSSELVSLSLCFD